MQDQGSEFGCLAPRLLIRARRRRIKAGLETVLSVSRAPADRAELGDAMKLRHALDLHARTRQVLRDFFIAAHRRLTRGSRSCSPAI